MDCKTNQWYNKNNAENEIYDKLDNDNLSWEIEEIPFYSYGYVYNILKVKRSVMGSGVSLDFAVPKKADSVNTAISYNSLLGSREIVNIPILWVKGEVYVLIDGIYGAMEELILRPRVMGNMDKIPYYVSVVNNLDDGVKIITTDAVYVDIDGERKYFNEVLYTPDGIYLPLDRIIEICGRDKEVSGKDLIVNNLKFDGTIYKMVLRNVDNDKRIIGADKGVEVYSVEENSSDIMTMANDVINQRISYKNYLASISVNNKEYIGIHLPEFKPAIYAPTGLQQALNAYGRAPQRVSNNGIDKIKGFELGIDYARDTGIGQFDTQGNLIGIYPHYVFTKKNGIYVSDGGITLGYGHFVSEKEFNDDSEENSERKLVETYVKGNISILPIMTKDDEKYGLSRMVPNSIPMSIKVATELYEVDLEEYADYVDDFLQANKISLKQHQFDALVSITYNYGNSLWNGDKHVMRNFILEGKYDDPEKVRYVFKQHDINPDRRAQEAELFINGYDD